MKVNGMVATQRLCIQLLKNTFVDFDVYYINGYKQWSIGLGRGSSWMKSGMGVPKAGRLAGWLSWGPRGRKCLEAWGEGVPDREDQLLEFVPLFRLPIYSSGPRN